MDMFDDDYAKNGLLGHVRAGATSKPVIPVFLCARYFTTGQMIVFLNPITGLKTAGPVKVQTYDRFSERLVVSNNVSVEKGDAIYISGFQDGFTPPKVGFQELENQGLKKDV